MASSAVSATADADQFAGHLDVNISAATAEYCSDHDLRFVIRDL
jgi:hypothetical protein